MPDDKRLLGYFKEIAAAVAAAQRGEGDPPYRNGTFLVSALAGDVELTISAVTEEDAVLIAAELREMGVKALVRGSVVCPACGERVPAQAYCTSCRAKLPES